MQKTVMGSKETVQRNWVVIDVKDKVLGRAATTIASILRGKHKPIFTPHADCGDFVVVINAEKVKLTGKKWADKKYIHHTMFPGGLKEYSALKAVERRPTRLVEDAVRRMLPRTNLGRALMKKLKIYAGDKHPHAAQQPTAMEAVNA
ncbi:MAG TPA: 50S ribosomal protein L13 [Myxococcales bacterium]|jgi:large subunit ribosomal protein L13|nr:50S ribosomal protein L13 [Myxococcales bacterium]